MCGRIVYIWDAATGRLVSKLVDDAEADSAVSHVVKKNRYNVPPASHLPVISLGAQDHVQRETHRGSSPGRPIIEIARWGFPIPQRPNGVFNTRIESMGSPMWASMWGRSHCLWPIAGFYEWQRTNGKRKAPHFIHRRDGEAMFLGGIVGWRDWRGEPLRCASVVTCPPNAAMATLHDRMPVVIEPADALDWLTGGAKRCEDLAIPADGLTMHPVGAAVGDTKNDDPSLMAPVNQRGLEAF